MPFNDQANPLNYPANNRNPFRRFREDRAPTQQDFQNFRIGDFWIDTAANELYFLVDKKGISIWIKLSGGGTVTETLTGNTGGAVPPDAGDNINVVGTGKISTNGNPGTNTLTISTTAGGAETLTGNTGGAVSPDGADNINFIGMTPFTVVGNPGANTLTIENDGKLAEDYVTDSGTAQPAADILKIVGGTSINTSGATNVVTINSSGDIANQYTENTGTAAPSGNNLNVLGTPGTNGIDTSGAGSTVTIGMKSPFTVENFTFQGSTAGTPRVLEVKHTDSANPTSDAQLSHSVGGTSAGDAYDSYSIGSARSYSCGPDTSDSQAFKMTTAAAATVTPSTGTEIWKMSDIGIRTMPLQPSFFATKTGTNANATGDNTFVQVVFDNVVDDRNNDYDNTTGLFTAPVLGLYDFSAYVEYTNLTAAHTFAFISFITTAGKVGEFRLNPAPIRSVLVSPDTIILSASQLVELDAAETCFVRVAVANSTKTIGIGNNVSGFGGFLVV